MDDRFVNLGEEVILTLQWQSGASESATVCFVISLSICYWLLCARACVCVWERRERDRVTSQHISYLNRACVWVSERGQWERERERERERWSHHSGVYSASEIILIAACLQTHTSIITVSVTRLCSPLGLDLMVKLRTLLTVFTLILKAEAGDYGKGRYLAACGVRPITMHCASWPIIADCACRKEELCRKLSVWERRGIEDLQ